MNLLHVYDRLIYKIIFVAKKFYSSEENQRTYTIYTVHIYWVLAFILPIGLMIESLIGNMT